MKTAIVSKKLLDICLVHIHLLKKDLWITAMYRGATFIGLLYNTNEITPDNVKEILSQVIPKSINDIGIYQNLNNNKVSYLNDGELENYYYISDEEYFKSQVVS